MLMRYQLPKLSQTVGSFSVGQFFHMGGGTFLVSALLVNNATELDTVLKAEIITNTSPRVISPAADKEELQ